LKIIKEDMKKIIAFLIISVSLLSCYDEYIVDFDYNSVSFPYQVNVRTFVVGEGMKIEIGVALGGVRENNMDRNVDFRIDNSLITPEILEKMKSEAAHIQDNVKELSTLLPLPANYYTLSNSSRMVIKKGQHMGSVVMKADSAAFLADPATINAAYVLPLYITDADADTILESKRFAVIGVQYENMLFGKYWHGGSALVNRPNKPDTTVNYFTTVPQVETRVWDLKTTGPNSLYANGYLDQVTARQEMMLTLNGSSITVSTSAGSTWEIQPEGTSSYNRPKLLQDRKIYLKYSFINTANGYTYHCTDTLTFRNRIRDGVNEWYDENPSHYDR
jgi:hypothetical protein